MAKSVWHHPKDIEAFNSGRLAASAGKPRVCLLLHPSYNERAAFNDGWDSIDIPPRKPSVAKRRSLPSSF